MKKSLNFKYGGKKAVKLEKQVFIARAIMLLLVKCYNKKQRFMCLLSGHLSIDWAPGA